ncbi:hypothetical protein R3P38DRAFT_3242829 [Favolaschia claudopus]|uniref:Uncharacterized protein n=1 Tax=Favolaschia claudopus TaxID=2862362 RepID=A0AAV9Z1Z6_9AGAR
MSPHTFLPCHPDFTAAMQIKLARQYSLDDWAAPAFQALIKEPLHKLTLEDAEHMGIVTYYKLVELKMKIMDHRIGLAFYPAEITHSFGCRDEVYCSKLWNSFWWGGFGKQLLHPENNKTPGAIIACLRCSHWMANG